MGRTEVWWNFRDAYRNLEIPRLTQKKPNKVAFQRCESFYAQLGKGSCSIDSVYAHPPPYLQILSGPHTIRVPNPNETGFAHLISASNTVAHTGYVRRLGEQ